jgi:DnaJ-class molecular chaperone
MARPRAWCTFCKASVAVTSKALVAYRHKAFVRTSGACHGSTRTATKCDACEGTGQVMSIYGTTLDAQCNVCKGCKAVIK